MVRLQQLPSEVAEKIAAMVAACDSDMALENTIRLHRTCRLMRSATSSKAVAIALPLRRLLPQILLLKNDEFLRLIGYMADAGNVEARFLLGMHQVFIANRTTTRPPLEHLRQAASFGHRQATYVLALAIYRTMGGEGSNDEAKKLLRSLQIPMQMPFFHDEAEGAYRVVYEMTRRFPTPGRLTVPERRPPGNFCCTYDGYCTDDCTIVGAYGFFFCSAALTCQDHLFED